jgi:hypothetical protein
MTEKEKNDEQDAQALAQIKMLNQVFEPTDERLAEMTVLSRVMPLPLSMMDMFDQATKPNRRKSLMELWRTSYYKHLRSVGGMLKNQGVALAMEQIGASEEEEIKEAEDW